MPRSSCCRVLGAILVGIVVAASCPAARAEPELRRSFGVGVGSSFGYLGGATRTLEQGKAIFSLLDVNLLLPVTDRVVLQLWAPVSWIVWENLHDPLVELALVARVHPLARSGFFVGSGLDVAAFKTGSDRDFNWSVRVPLAVGYETGFAQKNAFGLTIAVRPAFGLLVDENGARDTVTTYGFAWSVLLQVDLVGYFREPARPQAPPASPSSS